MQYTNPMFVETKTSSGFDEVRLLGYNECMQRKEVLHFIFISIFLLLYISCQTTQENQTKIQQSQMDEQPRSQESIQGTFSTEYPYQGEQTQPVHEEFDPTSISQEVFNTTKSEVQILIETLNEIIRKRDYSAWTSYLSPAYREKLSDPEFLKAVSETNRLKSQNIVLKSLYDYFMYVVVPSRANDRVDDIEFIGENRVKAYTVTGKGQRLRLYDLEKTTKGWNIIN